MNWREALRHYRRESKRPCLPECAIEIFLLMLAGLFWQTGCTSMAPMPSMPVMTRGSVDSLSDRVGHLKHSVDLMETMFEDNQRERERSLKQLETLVQESTGALLERERRLQSGLGTLTDQPRGQRTPESPASVPSTRGTDRFAAMHRNAYSSYLRGDFRLAHERYMQLYRQAASPAQKGQALFWAGECAYSMKDWDRAIAVFNTLQKEFPGDPLVRSALLKTATAYGQKGDRQKAREALESLIGQFPNSEEAELARRRLADVSGS